MWWILGLIVMFIGGVVAGGMLMFTRRGPVLVHSSVSVHNTHTTQVTHHVTQRATERVIVPVLPSGQQATVEDMFGVPAARPHRQQAQLEPVPPAQAVARVVPGWTKLGPHTPGEGGS